ncbi:MAG: hypothetical protein AAAB20_21780 [Rhizobium sp.]|uniref:hypothetical protein n=1 Tax=Rhizobium sp. TaxID=391 RepID=UPI00055E1E5D
MHNHQGLINVAERPDCARARAIDGATGAARIVRSSGFDRTRRGIPPRPSSADQTELEADEADARTKER